MTIEKTNLKDVFVIDDFNVIDNKCLFVKTFSENILLN
jgi:hypothetical protein